MEASFRQVLRGSKRKRSRQGCYLLAHKPEVLEELVAQIASGTFRVKDYREREIIEGGKLRRIQVIPMKDRIAVTWPKTLMVHVTVTSLTSPNSTRA